MVKSSVTVLEPVTNGAKAQIEAGLPYRATITVEGVAPLLFHAWNIEAVKEKGAASKGSKAKKSDDLESYVYRTEKGTLGLKGESLHRAICAVGKFHQDPRSPRKSAHDLLMSAVFPLSILADTGATTWDFVHQARVVVQRNAITRSRPALNTGWRATFELAVQLPEYVSPQFLNELVMQAGKLNGMGDHRPTYGRFQVVEFKVSPMI